MTAAAGSEPGGATAETLARSAEVLTWLVDGAAGLSDATRAAMLLANWVLCPVQPGGADLISAVDELRVVCQARRKTQTESVTDRDLPQSQPWHQLAP